MAKKPSAGKGPNVRMPSLHACRMAGMMHSISSRPSTPPSPACGLRPSTAILGRSTPKSRLSEPAMVRSRSPMRSVVTPLGTSQMGMWPVTRPTRRLSATIIIVWEGAPTRSAINSVWPGTW